MAMTLIFPTHEITIEREDAVRFFEMINGPRFLTLQQRRFARFEDIPARLRKTLRNHALHAEARWGVTALRQERHTSAAILRRLRADLIQGVQGDVTLNSRAIVGEPRGTIRIV